ncbi:MAG: phage virion morphogenesis protein [Myxococcota bacterium]
MAGADDCKVTLDASALPEALKAYERFGGNLADLMPLVAEDLVEATLERFELESGHEQGPWQPLAPSTLARRRHSKSPKMLRDSGVLFGSIAGAHGEDWAEAYTNVPHAKYHTSKAPRSHLPLRDFFDIDLDAVSERAAELILGELP